MSTLRRNYTQKKMTHQATHSELDAQRSAVQTYTGRRIATAEADDLLKRISDHRWYVSENLKRDVGFHVAAIGYVENFYSPSKNAGKRPGSYALWGGIKRLTSKAIEGYLKGKSETLPL